ncbi:MAG: glucosaminidase domain-containing protein [Saprospiraceae bacterium]|nr:glucosaminidase domain-containing protein [Saprospiraceae bacterium]
MAQGLLESGCGNSRLSMEGNNHFGIKCKDYWMGDTLMVLDDDYNAEQELIASCFRVYESAAVSYRDHSDFLMLNTSVRQSVLRNHPIIRGVGDGSAEMWLCDKPPIRQFASDFD